MLSWEDFLCQIGLSPEARGAVLSWKGEAAFGPDPLSSLVFCCRSAYGEALPRYEERGIDLAVFIDTFRDIGRWADDYRLKNGGVGLGEIRWLGNHLRLELFALGALQYQTTGEEGRLNLHIPKGADISPASVDASLREALSFFQADHLTLVCSSWLLSRELSALLDDGSRIKAFAARFTHISDDYGRRQAEERIFGHLEDDPMRYSVTSSLSARARDFLAQGGRLPVTTGSLEVSALALTTDKPKC